VKALKRSTLSAPERATLWVGGLLTVGAAAWQWISQGHL
jgi:hypothetical protein